MTTEQIVQIVKCDFCRDRAQGFHGSMRRRKEAALELDRRAHDGDEQAATMLNGLREQGVAS